MTTPLHATRAVSAEAPPVREGVLRFGVFELDLRGDELRKAGEPVRLQPQPFRLLKLLATHPRRLFTRDEIQRELWGDGTYVDFEQGINFCVSRVRAALSDQADAPRYVETVPRRGYRWIGPTEWTQPLPSGAAARTGPALVTPLPWRPPAARRTRGRFMTGLVVGAGAAALLVVAAALLLSGGEAPQAPRWTRATVRAGSLISARFGRGDELLYSAAWDGGPPALYAGLVGSLEAHDVPLRGEWVVGVSAGGELAYVYRGAKARVLARAPLAGGLAKDVLESAWMADWDGTDFAVARAIDSGAVLLEYPVGQVLASFRGVLNLRISPDRRRVAVLEPLLRDDDRGRVVVVERGGAERELGGVWSSTAGLAWSPRGDEVWLAATREGSDLGLVALPLAGGERVLQPALGRLVLHDVDSRGRALVERRTERVELPAAAGSGPERNLAWLGFGVPVCLSRDGRTLVMVETGEGAGPDYATYTRDLDGSPAVRVGAGRATDMSPDGRFVAAIPVSRPERIDLLPIGPGAARQVRFDGIDHYTFAGFHPDGRRLVFRGGPRGQAVGLRVGPLAGGASRPIGRTDTLVTVNSITPDGRHVVASAADGRLHLVPLDGGPTRAIPDTEGYRFAGWSEDGAEALVWTGYRFPLSIERLDLRTGARRPWRQIGPADLTGVHVMPQVRVADGGAAYAYSHWRRLSELFVVEGLK